MICISFLLSLILIFTGGFYMYRLILVEDDYQIRTGLSSFFPWNSTGFQLLASFENGKKALDFLRTHKVDVILTDIKMPVMNGLELAKAIREFSADINVVFLSAYRNFDFAREALEYGVRNYIVKSTRYDDLIEIFSQLKEELDARGNLSPAPSPAAEPRVDNQVIRQIIEAIDNDISNASLQHLADLVQHGIEVAVAGKFHHSVAVLLHLHHFSGEQSIPEDEFDAGLGFFAGLGQTLPHHVFLPHQQYNL